VEWVLVTLTEFAGIEGRAIALVDGINQPDSRDSQPNMFVPQLISVTSAVVGDGPSM
jgi:hypothetical protein